MIRFLFTALLALAVPSTAAPAQIGDAAAIRQAELAFEAAQTGGDTAALDRLLAPDFLFVRASGRIGDKRDFVEGFGSAGHPFQPFVVTDPLLIRPTPDTAITGGETWLRTTGNDHVAEEHFRFANTLARRNGRWVIVYSQITGLPIR